MRRLILSSAIALFVAGHAHAQRPAQCYDTSNRPYDLSAICGDGGLAWPTICRPAYVGSMGETIPEYCATFAPDAGDSAEGMTLYDPATGYRPPAAVVLANLRQTEALQMFGRIGYHWNAAYPAHEGAYAMGLDFGQYNELVNLAASGARDSGLGTHVRYTWTGPYYADTLAGVAALCGTGTALSTRCGRAAQTIHEIENSTTFLAEGMGYHNGASLSQATLVTMFNVLRRPMVPAPGDTCGRPLLCEMP